MGRVVVVGSYIVALVMDVDRLPQEGETLVGRNYRTTHGGKGSNMAAAAARLGANTVFVGKIGHDHYGEQFQDLLRAEGVDGRGVLYAYDIPTAVGFIISAADGSNLIVIDRGACGDFSPLDVRENAGLIESADVVLSPLEIPLDTALEGARVASDAGAKAILNPAPATDLTGVNLQGVFALTPNESEARVCLGLSPSDAMSDEEAADRLFDLGVPHVMITRGERGVFWKSAEGLLSIPAPDVQVRDTVGAGDAFNAGLACGLAEGRALAEAIALGVTTASLSTEKRDAIGSYPYRDEVVARLDDVLRRI